MAEAQTSSFHGSQAHGFGLICVIMPDGSTERIYGFETVTKPRSGARANPRNGLRSMGKHTDWRGCSVIGRTGSKLPGLLDENYGPGSEL